MGKRSKRLLTKQEAGEALGVKQRTVEKYLTEGLLRGELVPAVGLKKERRVLASSVESLRLALQRKAG